MSDPKQQKTPIERAVALEYDSPDELPRVLASGLGEVAEQIVEVARQHGVPVREDEELSALLFKLKPEQFINPETFHLAAQLLSFLYHCDRDWRKKHKALAPVMTGSSGA